MNESYLKAAQAKYKELSEANGETFDVRLFITGVSKRAAQLAKRYKPLIPVDPEEKLPYIDIALKEVAAGAVIIRHGDFSAVERAERQEEQDELTSL